MPSERPQRRGGMPHGGRPWEIWPWRLEVEDEGRGNQRFWITPAEETVVIATCFNTQSGELISHSESSQFAHIVRSGSGPYAGKSSAVDLANGRLIVKSPELFEMLAIAVGEIEEHHREYQYVTPEATLQAMRAVLAEALEGGQNAK